MGRYKNGHQVKLLGLSATPDRKDGYFVENAFPHRAHVVEIEDLMDSGRYVTNIYQENYADADRVTD
jgi:superfamily II DNA or RNA helicase